MIPHAGITHASGWIIIKKIQVAITQEVSTIRNNLIFANNCVLCGENSDENSDEPPTMFTFALILLL